MKRRDFVRQGLIAGSACLFPHLWIKQVKAQKRVDRITILQTNDTHSRIDPFPLDGGKNQGLGGMSRRAALVERIRQQNPNVLLLDGGDVLQGTPYYNLYKGRVEYETMTACGYDASTLGNHEFDSGVDSLANALSYAKFDILNCNYDFGKSMLRPFIKTFATRQIGAIKVGITGVGIDFADLVAEQNHLGINYHHPYKSLQSVVSYLRKDQQCQLVVVLSHLGYKYKEQQPSDVEMASEVHGIDWIVGGHTHTFLNQPEVVVSGHGHVCRILQVGWGGVILGKSDLYFEDQQLTEVRTDCIRLDSITAENFLSENLSA
jgi:5'-nucleotidase